jgi:hypothetical protein
LSRVRRCLRRSAIACGRLMSRQSPRCSTSKEYNACPPFGRRLTVYREGDILLRDCQSLRSNRIGTEALSLQRDGFRWIRFGIPNHACSMQHADWSGGRHGWATRYSTDIRQRRVVAVEIGALS